MAVWDQQADTLSVTMSRPVYTGGLVDGSGFLLRAESHEWHATNAAAFGTTLTVTGFVDDGVGLDREECLYDGTQAALVDDLGRSVPAWGWYPWEEA